MIAPLSDFAVASCSSETLASVRLTQVRSVLCRSAYLLGWLAVYWLGQSLRSHRKPIGKLQMTEQIVLCSCDYLLNETEKSRCALTRLYALAFQLVNRGMPGDLFD